MKHGFLLFSFLLTGAAFAQPYDLVIKNGRVIDGSGKARQRADVAITGGRIVKIGTIPATEARRVIDANGQIVTPGFIDVHAHVETDLEEQPDAPNFIFDGVTTLITGNCGGSNINMKAYFDTLRRGGMSLNLGSLIGHNSVRMRVLKTAFREPTTREQSEMERLVEQAMKDGAVGLSTGLIYTPGTYAKTPEVVGLAQKAAQYGGVYASHIRNEGQEVKKAILEAIQIGREARIPVEISHFKVASKPLWGGSVETIALVEAARRDGVDVMIDQYPYTASSTSLQSIVPSWALADGDSTVQARFRDPASRTKIKAEMLESLAKNGRTDYDYAVVSNYRADTTYNGLSISKINQKLGRPATADSEAELVMDLIDRNGMKRVQMVYHTMSEQDVETILRYPNTMVASDAGVATFGSAMPHPRAYGTNTRVLARYVRERKIISLEEAIRRMTSLPAQRFKLEKRGLLQPGYAADVVIFDEKTVSDQATYDKPHAYATGISWVLVNGVPVVEAGKHTHQRPGAVLLGAGFVAKVDTNATPADRASLMRQLIALPCGIQTTDYKPVILKKLQTYLTTYQPDVAYPEDRFSKAAVEQALAGALDGGYGIGAVLVDGAGRILHGAYNVQKQTNRSDLHAEMNLLTDFETLPAFKKYMTNGNFTGGGNTIYTEQLTLYTSAEPCPMCFIRVSVAGVETRYVTTGPDDGMKQRAACLPPFWYQLSQKHSVEQAKTAPVLRQMAHCLFYSFLL